MRELRAVGGRAGAAGRGRRAGIVVTVAGRPVAQLGPLDPSTRDVTIDDLVARGLVVRARRGDRPAPTSQIAGPAPASTGSSPRSAALADDAGARHHRPARPLPAPARTDGSCSRHGRRPRLVRVGARPERGAGAGRPHRGRPLHAWIASAGPVRDDWDRIHVVPVDAALPRPRRRARSHATARDRRRASTSPPPTGSPGRSLRHLRPRPDPRRARPRLRRRVRLTPIRPRRSGPPGHSVFRAFGRGMLPAMTFGPSRPRRRIVQRPDHADTFATVAQSDRSWTEKVCAMAARHGRRDPARRSAWASTRTAACSTRTRASAAGRAVDGPRQPPAVARRRATRRRADPLRGARAAAVDPVQPRRERRACRSRSSGRSRPRVPAALEQHEHHRSRDGLRLDADIVRYHQIGTASGWVEIDGERTELATTLGVDPRPLVGRPLHGRRRRPTTSRTRPARRRVDGRDLVAGAVRAAGRHALRRSTSTTSGTRRGLGAHRAPRRLRAPRRPSRAVRRARAELVGPRRQPPPASAASSRARWPTARPGRSPSPPSATPASTSAPGSTSASTATGTASGAATCTSTASTSPTARTSTTARRIHQFRDCLVRVDDPVGGGTGFGNLQSIFAGAHPRSA